MHGASLLFQPFPAPCLCCTPREGSAAGGAPAGLGRAPPAPSPVPGPFSAVEPRLDVALLASRGFLVRSQPRAPVRPRPILCCGRSVEGEGVTAGSVVLGWPKEGKKMKPMYLTMYFALFSAFEHFLQFQFILCGLQNAEPKPKPADTFRN